MSEAVTTVEREASEQAQARGRPRRRAVWLERLWSSVADRGRAYAPVPAAGLPPLDRANRLAEALLSERGEASGAAVAREI